MPLLRATCPECGASLKTNNPAGFAPGQALECPKCQTYFAVEEPKVAVAKPKIAVVEEDDEDDERSKKKRRRDRDDDDRPRKKKTPESGGYRTSPIRFVVLGVLVVVLIVAAVLLKMKWDKEKQEQSRIPMKQVFRAMA